MSTTCIWYLSFLQLESNCIKSIRNQLTEKSTLPSRTVLICQGRTCSSSGSAKVLVAFQVHSPPDVTVVGCGCLGQCGNGPMVLILPEETWYNRLSLKAVTTITEQHLCWGKPVVSMLYHPFHPIPSSDQKRDSNFFLGWLLALILMITVFCLLYYR